MLNAAPIIDVFTGGIDWAGVASAIAAGVVGIGGIVGTYKQAKKDREKSSVDLKASLNAANENLLTGISAEDRRAEVAEKRRIYAACQAAFIGMISPVLRQRRVMIQGSDFEGSLAIVAQPRDTMTAAVSEIRLVAPIDIGNLASAIQAAYLNFIDDTRMGVGMPDDGSPMAELQEELYALMRADLGVTEPATSGL